MSCQNPLLRTLISAVQIVMAYLPGRMQKCGGGGGDGGCHVVNAILIY